MKDKVFKTEMKGFHIDIDDIEPSNNLFGAIQEAIIKMKYEYFADRLEVILNNNLIDFKDKLTNYHTILGCKVSYDDLPQDVSFIVKPSQELTYEELGQENKQLKQALLDIKEYAKLSIKMSNDENEIIDMEHIVDIVNKALGDKE